jgi:polar amino acid transport system substrate-binding protein
VIIEGVYMVRAGSPLRSAAEVDRAGVRIGVNKGSAYDLYLSRTLKQATLERSDNGVEAFMRDNLDAAGGVKQPLAAHVAAHAGLRLLDGRFMEIRQALGLPKGRGEAAAAFVGAFIAEMKESGFVAAALKRSGQGEELVAG